MVHKVVSPTKPVGVPLAHGSHAREAVGALEPVLFHSGGVSNRDPR
jgi:hypothetical protein